MSKILKLLATQLLKVHCGLVILVLFISSFCCTKKQRYHISSTILVDKESKSIVFTARLNPATGKKYFLFHFSGYPWMEEYSIFVSSSTLVELQNAVAFIDWQLWEDIYFKRKSPKLKIYVFDNNQWRELNDFIQLFNFNTYQTTFWGDPAFDPTVLRQNYKENICMTCPAFSFEKEIILAGKKVISYKFLKALDETNFKFKLTFAE